MKENLSLGQEMMARDLISFFFKLGRSGHVHEKREGAS